MAFACGITILLLKLRNRRRDKDLEPWYLAVRAVADAPSVSRRDLPCEILPHLLYGDKGSALDTFLLQALGVTHILNVAGPAGNQTLLADYPHFGIKYLQLDGQDEEDYNMVSLHHNEASEFIREAREVEGKCLVHCVAGINRSGVLVAAELMIYKRLPVIEAVKRCKAARGTFLLNEGFQRQLVQLAHQEGLLGPKPSKSQTDLPPRRRRGANKAAKNAFMSRIS
ncbi:hypothetical protein CYMTET_12241 [Cymbomonas tetramitiformis]|uniref:protein-serine/threonine phosphatase n=1 Tax=Cymbomonas tetramitiformis TaxID=36881 RepID=A0AAE0GM28_9CHLO|nr:hypothetical protein CYMTET_12241 [Cymbomonas tetramitiformis]